MKDITERRQFHRIKFDNDAKLSIDGRHIDCRLIDLSLKGALVTVTNADQPDSAFDVGQLTPGQTGTLSFDLGDPAHLILMDVEIAHSHDSLIGMHCIHIDVDSISHLRRIIELNMGDTELLNRELEAFLHHKE
jgi:hypothetical protein